MFVLKNFHLHDGPYGASSSITLVDPVTEINIEYSLTKELSEKVIAFLMSDEYKNDIAQTFQDKLQKSLQKSNKIEK